ncbi:hypothetical protein CCACVL1_10624 [Corchorus capsularis]|uniref:F-box domain-containing protein n=1 Tax=Corchorus capsularis TaxID=210143 RepID=A0A1R3IQF8_COCAP|nr:hypothetical protein CCACVL1_10624 [Corchorus capsularis]
MNRSKRCKVSIDKNRESCSRRWEDLDYNILRVIFNLVSDKDLLCNVTGVCRSWQRACLDLLFWSDPKAKALDFRNLTSSLGIKKETGMVFSEGVDLLRRVWPRIARNILEGEGEDADWGRSLTKIFIPAPLCFVLVDEDLVSMAERTPGVESLILFGSSGITRGGFAKAMVYWRNVTHLGLGERSSSLWKTTMDMEILEEMGKSCPKLATLEIRSSTRLETEAARAIVRSVPKLMTLRLENVKVFKGAIRLIISNSPELKVIEFRSCDLRFENSRLSSDTYRFSFDWTRKGDSEEWCFQYCSALVTDDIEHKVEFPVSDDYDLWIH